MSVTEIMARYGEQQGWSEHSKLEIVTGFLELQRLEAEFEAFVREIVGIENGDDSSSIDEMDSFFACSLARSRLTHLRPASPEYADVGGLLAAVVEVLPDEWDAWVDMTGSTELDAEPDQVLGGVYAARELEAGCFAVRASPGGAYLDAYVLDLETGRRGDSLQPTRDLSAPLRLRFRDREVQFTLARRRD